MDKMTHRRFKIVDPTTGNVLAGYDGIEADNGVFLFGKPMPGEKNYRDLNVGERALYRFHTGAGSTDGIVYRLVPESLTSK